MEASQEAGVGTTWIGKADFGNAARSRIHSLFGRKPELAEQAIKDNFEGDRP
jgi:hypothetical protein